MISLFNSLDREYQKRILRWLPTEIFDFHTHIGLPEHHSLLSPERAVSAMAASEAFDQKREELEKSVSLLFPGRTFRYLTFPFPFREVDTQLANKYVLEAEFPLILADLKNENATIALLENSKVRGLKVYYDFVDKSYRDISIQDFVRPSFMNSLNAQRKILMLHVPKNSLNNESNLLEILGLNKQYPNMPIVLAHMGRCHTKLDMYCALEKISKLENVFLDTSTVSEPEVFTVAAKILGPKRILYASDSPYSDTRGRIMDIPGPMGKAFITPNIYPWTLPELRKWYLDNKPPLTFLVYHQLDSMKRGFDVARFSDSDLRDVFSRNAERIIGL